MLKTICILAIFAGGLRVVGVLLPANLARSPQGRDFVQDWSSARNYFASRPIYADLAETLPGYLGPHGPLYFQVNAHPPASVLLTLPLGRLPFNAAFLTWQAISFVAILAAIWLIVREPDLGYTRWAFLAAFALLLVSNVMTELTFHGPLNALLFLLIVSSWSAQRRDRFVLAGSLVGIAAAIKLFPAFLILFFLARRQYRAVVAAAVALVLVNGVTAAMFGTETFRQYYSEVVPRVAVFRDYWMNASITGWISKLFDSPGPQVTPILQSPLLAKLGIAIACGLAVVAIAHAIWRADGPAQSDHAFSMTILGMLLVSPVTWNHYFLFMILPLLLWWRMCDCFRQKFVIAAVYFLLVFSSPAWVWRLAFEKNHVEVVSFPGETQAVAAPWQTLTILSIQFYALAGLMLWSLAVAHRLGYSPQSRPIDSNE